MISEGVPHNQNKKIAKGMPAMPTKNVVSFATQLLDSLREDKCIGITESTRSDGAARNIAHKNAKPRLAANKKSKLK
jgi:hypothetical protein